MNLSLLIFSQRSSSIFTTSLLLRRRFTSSSMCPPASDSKSTGNVHQSFLAAQFAGLPALPNVEQLTPRVLRILGGNPGNFTLQGTNTYLVGTGRNRILIDTAQGFPQWREHLTSLLTSPTSPITITHCLITHRHHDHIGGISDVLSLSPSTRIHKNDPDEPTHADITDGQEFSVEGATLKAIYTPGHTDDHMCFHLAEENALFTGDNVLGHGTSVFSDLGAYMGSLRRMRDLKPDVGYPGHGAVLTDGTKAIETYILHRQRREDQIVGVMRKAAENGKRWLSSMEIVREIYTDTDENLHKAAEIGTLQVLVKLQEEGAVESRFDVELS
ncbi:Metallo-hydrolase/oxidoreductase [Ascodesmis nigricans]|uniref:Metallo-hydrolase/oxidoreductase n=1 Tax=Ascodesmis nigricans TaxID=341454 RepID=A0A4S2N1Z9_9PEZI|nr:Metallo-hydrolase/oxidoreductase [Ascodesmis nigricans]